MANIKPIKMELDPGSARFYEIQTGDSILADGLEKLGATGDLPIGSGLGSGQKLLLGSASSVVWSQGDHAFQGTAELEGGNLELNQYQLQCSTLGPPLPALRTYKNPPMSSNLYLALGQATGPPGYFYGIKLEANDNFQVHIGYFQALYITGGSVDIKPNGTSRFEVTSTVVHSKLDLDMNTNDIINVGNVDGRDVSVDGGTLDSHVADTSNPHSVTAAQSGAMADLVEDTSPQLGGNLDLNGFGITSSAGSILGVENDTVLIGGWGIHDPDSVHVYASEDFGVYVGEEKTAGFYEDELRLDGSLTHSNVINLGEPKLVDFPLQFETGQMQEVTLGANLTITSISYPGIGTYRLRVAQDATGGRTLTWPTAVKAPGGKATGLALTSTSNAVDIVDLYWDGETTWAKLWGSNFQA